MRRRRLGLVLTGLVMVAALGVVAQAAAEPNLCVATNGEVRVEMGTATCAADAGGNVAIARGDGSDARAGDWNDVGVLGGEHNKAFASGDNSRAYAGYGDGNTATASGDNSDAVADGGDNNTATASGDNSYAEAFAGDNNTATASGYDTTAAAGFGTDNNTATATTDGCTVYAGAGGQTASC